MPEHSVVLLAEDDEDYVSLIKLAFCQAGIRIPLYVVSTGQELVSYLKGDDRYENRDEYPLPDLLLLDLKLPGYNGFEILAWVRSHPGLTALRIVVLTSSDRAEDVNDAYWLGANSFLVKPRDFSGLVHFGKLMQQYWLEKSQCPQTFRSPKTDRPREEKGNPERNPIAGHQ